MDLLLNVPESSGPELEIARREMEAAEQAYLDADKAEDEFETPMPRAVKNRWHQAVARVGELEAAALAERRML